MKEWVSFQYPFHAQWNHIQVVSSVTYEATNVRGFFFFLRCASSSLVVLFCWWRRYLSMTCQWLLYGPRSLPWWEGYNFLLCYWLLKSRTPPRARQELIWVNRKIRMLISKKIRICLVSHFPVSLIPILLRRTFYVPTFLCLAQPSTSQPTTDTTTNNPDANEPLLRQSLVTSQLPSTSIAAT